MPQPHGPLQGVKVVSCSTAQAGTVPYMLMADLGADVIKVEVPKGGDPSRRAGGVLVRRNELGGAMCGSPQPV